MAIAYSFSGDKEKAVQTAKLLPEITTSQKQVLGILAPLNERLDFERESLYSQAESFLCTMSSIAKYYIYKSNQPQKAESLCYSILKVIDALGGEGYLNMLASRIYYDLTIVYAKTNQINKMYINLEKAIECEIKNDKTLASGGMVYESLFFKGLLYNNSELQRKSNNSNLQNLKYLLLHSESLKKYRNEIDFIKSIQKIDTYLENNQRKPCLP